MNQPAGPRRRDPFSWCLACLEYACQPMELAIDVEGTSPREADALCAPHRARMTEGACVLCGNRFPWVRLHGKSRVGACRPCYVAQLGEEAALEVEARWEALERAGGMPSPEGPGR